jgi:ribA/ribD-fused uncharacterized protein
MNTKSELIAALEKGLEPKYLFFWSHKPGGAVKNCLSQWFDSPFTVAGVRYATAEHWMMAEKARLFGDEAAAQRVLAAAHPGEAKQAGRDVSPFRPDLWAARRFEIVVTGNYHKFTQNPALAEFLSGTGERVLVEAAPNDAIWGIGVKEDDPRAAHPALWPGENLLGFALMAVRTRLQEGQ